MGKIKNITLFTQPSCGPCNSIKGKFKRENIAFEEVNIQESEAAHEKVKELGYSRTPVVFIETESGSYHFGLNGLTDHLSQLIKAGPPVTRAFLYPKGGPTNE